MRLHLEQLVRAELRTSQQGDRLGCRSLCHINYMYRNIGRIGLCCWSRSRGYCWCNGNDWSLSSCRCTLALTVEVLVAVGVGVVVAVGGPLVGSDVGGILLSVARTSLTLGVTPLLNFVAVATVTVEGSP